MKKLLLGISSVVLINTSYADPSIIVLDSRDRVVFVQSDSCNMRFDYDECDNILCERIGESSIEYKYSDTGELRKLGDKEFKYDNLGRLTYKSGNSIQYNEYNMMSNFNAFKYFYDTKSGLRSAKEVDGTRISFVLDDFGRVIEERNESNDVISSIEWNGDLPYIYHYGGNVYRYLCNAHGDVVALVDEDGVEVNSYSYDIFGKLISEKETIPNAIRYRHEYYDAESGMYYLRGRYYDPAMRRFTTPDPAEDGINHYAYCGNNPFMNIDPSGYAYFERNMPMYDEFWFSGNDLADVIDFCYADRNVALTTFSACAMLTDAVKRRAQNGYIIGAAYSVSAAKLFVSWLKGKRLKMCTNALRSGRGIKLMLLYDEFHAVSNILLYDVSAEEVEDYASGRRAPK